MQNRPKVLGCCGVCDEVTGCSSFPRRRFVREKLAELDKKFAERYGWGYQARRVYLCDVCTKEVVK